MVRVKLLASFLWFFKYVFPLFFLIFVLVSLLFICLCEVVLCVFLLYLFFSFYLFVFFCPYVFYNLCSGTLSHCKHPGVEKECMHGNAWECMGMHGNA